MSESELDYNKIIPNSQVGIIAKNIHNFVDHIVNFNISTFKLSSSELKLLYPTLNEEQIVDKLINNCKYSSAAIGFSTTIATQVPMLAGAGAAIAIGANTLSAITDFQVCTKMQVGLIVKIAALYGYKLDENIPLHKHLVLTCAFGGDILRALAHPTTAALKKGLIIYVQKTFAENMSTKLFCDFLEKIGVKVAKRITKRQFQRLIPFAGSLLSAGFNWHSARITGKNAKELFSKLKSMNQSINQEDLEKLSKESIDNLKD